MPLTTSAPLHGKSPGRVYYPHFAGLGRAHRWSGGRESPAGAWFVRASGQRLGEELGLGEDSAGRSRSVLGERQTLTFPVEVQALGWVVNGGLRSREVTRSRASCSC